MKTTLTFLTVLLLFCASLAESSIYYVCSLISCRTQCEEMAEVEPICESELQTCRSCPMTQPKDAIPISLDKDAPLWICVISLTNELTIRRTCENAWQMPDLTFVIHERPAPTKDQPGPLDIEKFISISAQPWQLTLSDSCPAGIHPTISSTVLRC